MVGTVFDVAGRPVPNALVKAVCQDWTHRKATMTDANGKFALRGLGEGLTMLAPAPWISSRRLRCRSQSTVIRTMLMSD